MDQQNGSTKWINKMDQQNGSTKWIKINYFLLEEQLKAEQLII
jgi:hypothetical protein